MAASYISAELIKMDFMSSAKSREKNSLPKQASMPKLLRVTKTHTHKKCVCNYV